MALVSFFRKNATRWSWSFSKAFESWFNFSFSGVYILLDIGFLKGWSWPCWLYGCLQWFRSVFYCVLYFAKVVPSTFLDSANHFMPRFLSVVENMMHVSTIHGWGRTIPDRSKHTKTCRCVWRLLKMLVKRHHRWHVNTFHLKAAENKMAAVNNAQKAARSSVGQYKTWYDVICHKQGKIKWLFVKSLNVLIANKALQWMANSNRLFPRL